MAQTTTVLTGRTIDLVQRWAQALARQLQQAKAGDLPHLNARAVARQGIAQAFFHLAVVFALFHVDEVDHHQAGHLAQAQLARDLVGGLQVGLESRVFDRAFARRLARVDVDRHQGFGLVDHQIAAGLQGDAWLVQLL